jgi:hypothetical protein
MTFKQFGVILLYVGLPWLKRLVADFLVRKPAFDPRQVLVGFVVENAILGQGFPRVFTLSLVNIIPSFLDTRLFTTATTKL